MEINQETKNNINEEREPTYRPPKVQNFRTLKSDMLGAVKKQDKSIAQMVLSAKEKKWSELKKEEEGLKKIYVENKYKKPTYKILLIIIIIIISSLLWINLFTKKEQSVQQKESVFSFVGTETKTADLNILGLGSTSLAEKISSYEKISSLNEGDVVLFNIIKKQKEPSSIKTLSTEEFTNLWAYNMPEPLLPLISGGSYVVGIYALEKTHSFVIYELTKNKTTTDLLEQWEKLLPKDTKRLFVKQKQIFENTFISATTAQKQVLRILEYSKNEPAIVYGFIDDSLLVISDSVDIFQKITPSLKTK